METSEYIGKVIAVLKKVYRSIHELKQYIKRKHMEN